MLIFRDFKYIKRHDVKSTYQIQQGAAEGKSIFKKVDSGPKNTTEKLIKRIFCRFSLEILEKVILRESRNQIQTNDNINISQIEISENDYLDFNVDLQSVSKSLCLITSEDPDLVLKTRSLQVLMRLLQLGAIKAEQDQLLLEAISVCLKELDSSQPALVQATFGCLKFAFSSPHDLNPEAREDLIFCFSEFLHISDRTTAVIEFTEMCLQKGHFLKELWDLHPKVLDSFFQAKDPRVSKSLAELLLNLTRLPFVGAPAAKKLSFDLISNLDKVRGHVWYKVPLIMIHLFKHQNMKDTVSWLQILTMNLWVFKCNFGAFDEGVAGGVVDLVARYLNLRVLEDTGSVKFGFEAVYEQIEDWARGLFDADPSRLLVIYKFCFRFRFYYYYYYYMLKGYILV